jgi:hypothetical protein
VKGKQISKGGLFLVVLLLAVWSNNTASGFETAKKDYLLGETVEIYSDFENSSDIQVSITAGDDVYRYLGRLDNPIMFETKREGKHVISFLNFSSKSLISEKNITVHDADKLREPKSKE